MFTATYTDRNGTDTTAHIAYAEPSYIQHLLTDRPSGWLVEFTSMMHKEIEVHQLFGQWERAEGCVDLVCAAHADVLETCKEITARSA